MDNKLSELTVGAFCIHTRKWLKRGCRVVAFDNGNVVIKNLGGGYHGVPAESLTITTRANAQNIERDCMARRSRG
ncbi:hypothetical protein [Serratia ureilytica]|uniref:hypothetical protein n=1 Tax=Serratia ureilytica TaxID=300181 RepID=UPI003FA6A500